jgi:hypothetical protein
MLPIAGEPDWVDTLVLLGIPLALVVIGYLLLKRSRHVSVRRFGALLVSLVAVVFGAFAIMGYAIPALDDFRNPQVSFYVALASNVITWSICLGMLALAGRVAWDGFGKRRN